MTTTPRSHQTHCTCCGGRDIRREKKSRWVIRGTSFWKEGDLVTFMVCPACDRIPVSES